MKPFRQVVVEGGHMVDAPDREEPPRFPPEAEPRIARAIAETLDSWEVGPDSLVISQGARGTDILVGEAALDRGAPVQVMLALPPDEFERASVVLPGTDWSRRFRELLARSVVRIQTEELGPVPDDESPFDRNNRWVLDEAGRLAGESNAPIRVLAVWDAAQEGGRGGTGDFVRHARDRGAMVKVIDPQEV